jgi:acetyl-CoA hydrolase
MLVRRLVEQRGTLGGIHVFFGTLMSESLLPDSVDGLYLISFGGLMKAGRLTRRGLVDVIPIRVSQVPRLIESGEIPVDVARARVVIAEVNDQAPFTFGSRLIDRSSIDVLVPVSYPPVEVKRRVPAPGSDVAAVAQNIAGLIPDGATVQLGIGGVIDALPEYMAGINDLGLHTPTRTSGNCYETSGNADDRAASPLRGSRPDSRDDHQPADCQQCSQR